MRNLARAIHSSGSDAASRLFNTPEMAGVQKELVQSGIDKVKEHWTARLSVHIWDRLELSRSKMETSQKLLTSVYDPETDKNVPIRIWENPNDPNLTFW